MTVKKHLQFALRLMPKELQSKKIATLLEATGLAPHANKYPAQLSGGQEQRLNFARAFAPEPTLLLCDEPFSSLDELTRAKMQAWLLNFRDRTKCTIIFVTHSIEEAVFLSDEVRILQNGNLCEPITIHFERPRTDEIRFEPMFSELRKQILREIRDHRPDAS